MTNSATQTNSKKLSSSLLEVGRALKQPLRTGTAAALSYFIYRSFHLSHGYWAVISAVIVMQSNLGRSISAGANRLLGTAIGALAGALVFRMTGLNVWGILISIVLTMAICSIQPLQQSQRLAGVTAAIVMLVGEGSAWQAGFSRFIDVALGIVVALLVSFLWPSRAGLDLRNSLAGTYRGLQQFFAAVVSSLDEGHPNAPVDQLREQSYINSRRNHDLVADLRNEPGRRDPVLALLTESSDRIRDHISGINYSVRTMDQDSLHRALESHVGSAIQSMRQAFMAIEADVRDDSHISSTGLTDALTVLAAEFDTLRQSGVTRSYGTEELLRLYSFFYRLQQLGYELERSLEFANALDHGR
ncbi:MAG TPA: FUSC family protein [Candidatus Angelobacter sp.]|jgi:uncharacterized membrane protein YccC